MWSLDAKTGGLAWFFDTEQASGENYAAVTSSPAVAGGKVYFGSCDCHIYALDAENGSLIWSYQAGGGVSYLAAALSLVMVIVFEEILS
jgi:outer membrane protein assembly factor BamB